MEMSRPRPNNSNVESWDILLTLYLEFIPLPLVGADDHLKMWILRSVEVKYIVISYSIPGYIALLINYCMITFSDNTEVAYLKTLTKEDIIKFYKVNSVSIFRFFFKSIFY